MRRSLNQLLFFGVWNSREAAVRLKRAKKLRVGRKNRRATEGVQPELHSIFCNRVQGMLLVLRKQHQRHYIAHLDVERVAYLVEKLGD